MGLQCSWIYQAYICVESEPMKIFCCTTGRTGTKFMASVFSLLTKIPSYHEMAPYCIGETSKDVNNNEVISENTRFVFRQKMAKIEHYSRDGNYFEANNMFIKSFIWPVMAHFDDVYCIYLHRNPMDTFLSHADRGWKFGYDWILQSHWKRNLLRTIEPLDYYENIMWNWFEVRKRFFHWKDDFVKTYDFDFRKLNDLEEYYKLFEHFGIHYKKIDRLPGFERNENVLNKPVTSRYESLMDEINLHWDERGKEWAFDSDVEDMKVYETSK